MIFIFHQEAGRAVDFFLSVGESGMHEEIEKRMAPLDGLCSDCGASEQSER